MHGDEAAASDARGNSINRTSGCGNADETLRRHLTVRNKLDPQVLLFYFARHRDSFVADPDKFTDRIFRQSDPGGFWSRRGNGFGPSVGVTNPLASGRAIVVNSSCAGGGQRLSFNTSVIGLDSSSLHLVRKPLFARHWEELHSEGLVCWHTRNR